MSSLKDKLEYLDETKSEIKSAIEEKGVTVEDNTTFREYAEKILEIETGGVDEPDPMPAFRGLYLPQFTALKGTQESAGSIFSVACKDISQVKSDLVNNPTNELPLNIQTSSTHKVGVGILTNRLNKEMVLNNTFRTIVANIADKWYQPDRSTLRTGEVDTAGWCKTSYNTQSSVPYHWIEYANAVDHTAYFCTSNEDVMDLMKASKLTVYRDYCVEFGKNKFSDYVNFNTIINEDYNENVVGNTHTFDKIMLEFSNEYLFIYYIASDVTLDYYQGRIYFNGASLDTNNPSIVRGRYTCSTAEQSQVSEAQSSAMLMVNPDGTDLPVYSAKTNNNYIETTSNKIIATFDIPKRDGSGKFVSAEMTFDELNSW